MQALQVRCASRVASIKRLKERIGSKVDALKKFKESSRTLSQEVVDLKAKLSGITHQADNLAKENALLKSEVTALHEHVGNVKEEAIEEYQGSQPYFNEMGGYYMDGFEDFWKQVVLMFPDLDFSQIQIKLTALMTPVADPIPKDVETNEELVVIDKPSEVADDPLNPLVQNDNPPAGP